MALKILFPVSGCGDCIIGIVEDESGDKHSLMVDCGLFTKEIKEIIEKELNNRIDCLIITHIDDDHIKGVIKMLDEEKTLIIGKILFNGSMTMHFKESSSLQEKERNVVQRLSELGFYPIEHSISGRQATSLMSIILNNKSWADSLEKECVTLDNPPMNLDSLGSLYILSPNRKALELLDCKYKSECSKLFYEKTDYTTQSLYELVIRYFNEKNKSEFFDGEYHISGDVINKEYLAKCSDSLAPNENSLTNNSSIAVVWEINGRKFLFLGDANPKIVCEGLKKYKDIKGLSFPIVFDAVKVSHHGSEYNTSMDLLEKIDSENFIFCGYNGDKAPHIKSIAKIITRPLNSEIRHRNLIYNMQEYRNRIINEFNKTNKITELSYNVVFRNMLEL